MATHRWKASRQCGCVVPCFPLVLADCVPVSTGPLQQLQAKRFSKGQADIKHQGASLRTDLIHDLAARKSCQEKDRYETQLSPSTLAQIYQPTIKGLDCMAGLKCAFQAASPVGSDCQARVRVQGLLHAPQPGQALWQLCFDDLQQALTLITQLLHCCTVDLLLQKYQSRGLNDAEVKHTWTVRMPCGAAISCSSELGIMKGICATRGLHRNKILKGW